MNTFTRRKFLAAAATLPVIGAMQSARGQDAEKKYTACIIGDTDHGGYGHSLHYLWAMRDDVEVVGLAEPHSKARKYYQKQSGALRTYSDYTNMLETEKPDLVAIGPRWATNHKEYLLACAAAGAHGIMEKPLAVDLAEADEAIGALEARNLKWASALNFRASPMIRKTRKLIFEEGLIGQVLEIRSRGKEDHRAGGEDLIVLGTHTLDMMIYFLGQPEWCEASVTVDGRPAEKNDVREATEPLGPIVGTEINAHYQFGKGIPAYFSSVKNPDGNQNRWGMEIYGTKGIVSIRMAPVPEVYVYKNPSWAPGEKQLPWERITPPAAGPSRHEKVGHYAPIVDDLIDSIENNDEPFTSVQANRDAHAMIQAVFESAVTRNRVTFPLEQRTHPLLNWA
jgi:predicted dehydrogenase